MGPTDDDDDDDSRLANQVTHLLDVEAEEGAVAFGFGPRLRVGQRVRVGLVLRQQRPHRVGQVRQLTWSTMRRKLPQKKTR